MIGQTTGQIFEDNLKLIERHEEDVERYNELQNILTQIMQEKHVKVPKKIKKLELFGLYNSYHTCKEPEKISYYTIGHARKAIKEHIKKYNQKMKIYECGSSVGQPHFHLTSSL